MNIVDNYCGYGRQNGWHLAEALFSFHFGAYIRHVDAKPRIAIGWRERRIIRRTDSVIHCTPTSLLFRLICKVGGIFRLAWRSREREITRITFLFFFSPCKHS